MFELIELQPLVVTPAQLFGLVSTIVIGVAGWIIFRRGRKFGIPRLTWIGVVLMIYPDFIPDPWLMWGVGLALLWLAVNKWVPPEA